MIVSSASPRARIVPTKSRCSTSAACRAAVRSCRSPRSSACGSRGSSWRGTRSSPRWRPPRRRGPPALSLNRLAFWIAITAWSAKVVSSAFSLLAQSVGLLAPHGQGADTAALPHQRRNDHGGAEVHRKGGLHGGLCTHRPRADRGSRAAVRSRSPFGQRARQRPGKGRTRSRLDGGSFGTPSRRRAAAPAGIRQPSPAGVVDDAQREGLAGKSLWQLLDDLVEDRLDVGHRAR